MGAIHGAERQARVAGLRGGYRLEAGPFGTFFPANITPHPETGIGKMNDADLSRVIRHGVGPAGKLDPLMAFAVGSMSDEDLIAVMSYLRSLPPIENRVPADELGFVLPLPPHRPARKVGDGPDTPQEGSK